jgi:NADH dehydrogenase
MKRKNIIIAGGGFGGLSTLKTLYKNRSACSDYNIILIDKKAAFEFIPMLPDILGGWLSGQSIQTRFEQFAKKLNFTFIQGDIKKVNLPEKSIMVEGKKLGYEFLVLATGLDSNFFGNESAKNNCHRLKEVKNALDAKREIILRGVSKKSVNVVVIGAGYTGLEVATNARLLMDNYRVNGKVTLVEKAERILPMMPDWLRCDIEIFIDKLGINVTTSNSLLRCTKGTVYLSSGDKLKNSVCIWTVGTRPGLFIQELDVEKIGGRIKVNSNLAIAGQDFSNVFAVGDIAAFIEHDTGQPLRMAIMFALGQGEIAGQNIINRIRKKDLNKFAPTDLGYLLPLAFGRAPGVVLGRSVSGRIGFWLHYIMSLVRAPKSNKLAIFKELLFSRILS